MTMHSRLRCTFRLLLSAALLSFSIHPLPAAQSGSDFLPVAEGARKAREDGNREEALRLYQQAVGIRSEWTEGWWYLGTLLYDADRFVEAVPALKKVTELAPGLGTAWSFLGLSEYETKDYSAAFGDLEKGLALGNTD